MSAVVSGALAHPPEVLLQIYTQNVDVNTLVPYCLARTGPKAVQSQLHVPVN